MNISIWPVTYQHYDEILNQSLNTCIILVGGRSDLFNSRGRWSKRGEGSDIFKIQWWELAKRGVKKSRGGFGPWMKLCATLPGKPCTNHNLVE